MFLRQLLNWKVIIELTEIARNLKYEISKQCIGVPTTNS